MTIVNCL